MLLSVRDKALAAVSLRYEIAPTGSTAFAHAFIAEQLVGAGLLVLLLGTVLICHMRQSTTWLNFIASCMSFLAVPSSRNSVSHNLCYSVIIFAVSYSLLTFTGAQTRPAPSFNLCLVQAALVYRAPPLCGATALAFTVEAHFSFRSYIFPALTFFLSLHRCGFPPAGAKPDPNYRDGVWLYSSLAHTFSG
jgi:hypothetical protein